MANAMNISQPIASDVENVEFTFLSPKEILAISVKRIENDSTFDNLLNPVPGGLYDPALGSYGDTPCATCNLNQSSCPGHTGHISLPAPVYHPIFLDQAYRLLRATCVYCKGFRLPEKDLHKYVSQLKLLQRGMLYEAHIAGAIGEHDSAVEAHWGVVSDSSEAEDEDDPASVNAVVRKREKYVRSCLRESKMKKGDARQGKHEGASEMRREVIKQFLAEITRTRICASCGGISPSYRKDGFIKIFENSLSDKERLKMGQKNMKRTDAMTRVFQKQSKTKPEKYTTDEGVADVDSPQHSDMEVDEVEDADSDSKAVQVVTARKIVSQRYISPMEVQARLSELFHKEQEMVFLLYNARPRTRSSPDVSPEMFFMTTILVPPNRFRPEARMGDEQVNEAQQNSLYKNIMRCNGRIAQVYKNMKEARADVTQLHQAWIELQEAINSLIDKDKNPVQGAAAARNEDGIKQKLEKKEGLFRKNMMGKRVNFAARSVISPDPNIETNEIGVPPVFAEKLTYPEPVTGHNFKELQNAVMNGPHKYPGAWAIESEDGVLINLRGKSMDQRIAIANTLQAPTNPNASKMRGKKVYRHLTNGDVVLMNRQPTLHKPSIMGHRVRVLPGEKTIRMHYANCNTYNADFDGDEMNMHFPQNEVARAEALNIADTDHQYLSYTAGKPLRGLIQDHISVSIALCNRDTFLNKGDYQQLVYSALRPESGDIVGERIQLVAPAIIKPVPRWTGKQVFTTILTNIQPAACGGLWLKGESQIKAEQWGSKESEEGTVLIQDGEFISGILDKAQIGPSSGGIIHAVHEAYGPSIAGKLLSSFGRLLTRYLNMRAFSCGMDDLRLTSAGEEARREALQAANRKGLEVASKYVSLDRCSNPEDPLLLERLEEVLRDDSKQEGLDLLMNSGSKDITDAVQKACIPNGLEKPFPKNQMQAMTTSGAKGSRVNASLISCNLGQQVLEGRRVPVMVSGKSLPCFAPFDSNVRAGGFIVNRFLTGIRPQEYYFHHMAGREGLIDTAVKTSRSGYLQRCVIKGMEGLTIGYDTTVRDADNSIVQFLYGEDGLDPTKQKYLTDFSFTLENARSAAYHLNYDTTVGERLGNNRKVLTEDMKKTLKSAKSGHKTPRDPVISKYNPATHAFVTSESFYEAFTKYLKENKDGLIVTKDKDKDKDDSKQNKQLTGPEKFNRKNAEVMFSIKYLRSLVEPGEAVGIVAGQSVGEPSTQMTLNTFHLAGHSAKNVTLGIPRLREILMTASRKISTPSMSLHPLPNLTEHDVDMLSKSVSVLPFADVLDKVSIEEKIGKGSMYGLAKMYRIRFDFFPASEYTETYGISINDVMSTIEKKLLATIRKLAKDEITARNSQKIGALPEIGEKVGTVEMVDGEEARPSRGGDDDDDDDDDGDDDATNAKQRANRSEAVSYGPNDDDDDAVQKAMDRDSEDDDMEDEGIGGSPPPSRASDADSDEDNDDSDEDASNAAALRSKARADRVKQAVVNVTRFKTDEETGEWCEVTFEYDAIIPKILMLNIVQNAIKKTVIRQISGIGSATTEKRVIHTNGVNLRAMQELASSVDVNKIETNDIGAVLEVYGVEACRGAIVRELSGVFGGHGIKVDNRHLNLIADYMTRNGDYTPFNRMGLRGNVSPFTKMSFETTLAFLKDAVLDGDWDDLTTPSSRLVMGGLSRVGTGGFDVLTKLPMYQFNPLA